MVSVKPDERDLGVFAVFPRATCARFGRTQVRHGEPQMVFTTLPETEITTG